MDIGRIFPGTVLSRCCTSNIVTLLEGRPATCFFIKATKLSKCGLESVRDRREIVLLLLGGGGLDYRLSLN